MKQKIFVFITTIALAISLTACGQQTDEEAEETFVVEREVTEQTIDEEAELVSVQSEQTEVVDAGSTEISEYGFDVYANAKEKFQRLHDAYFDILDGTDHPGALFLEIMQNNVENNMNNCFTDDQETLNILNKLKEIGDTTIPSVVLQAYYDKRINDNENWYNILDWVSQFDSPEEFNEDYILLSDDNNGYYYSDCVMLNTIFYAATIANVDEITFGEPFEENYLYSGDRESAYFMPIIINGENYNLYAVFDADGNLLNLDDWDSNMPEEAYIYTWGEDVDHKQ